MEKKLLKKSIALASLLIIGICSMWENWKFLAVWNYLLLLLGIKKRKIKAQHTFLMKTGIGLDFFLVLLLSVERNAIATASGGSMSILEMIHVICSSGSVLFYIPTLYLGLQLEKAHHANKKKWHQKVAYCAFFLRSLGLIFMFFVQKHAP